LFHKIELEERFASYQRDECTKKLWDDGDDRKGRKESMIWWRLKGFSEIIEKSKFVVFELVSLSLRWKKKSASWC
jgi:hypothetical protein